MLNFGNLLDNLLLYIVNEMQKKIAKGVGQGAKGESIRN